MSDPVLSVLMPVHNAADTVARAAASILACPMPDMELVIVNDASTDGTASVLSSFHDPRVRCMTRDEHSLVNALNAGIQGCRGSLIARMDADDWAHPDRLTRQRQYLEAHEIDGVGGAVRVLDRQGRPVPSWRRYESWVNDNRDPDAIAAYRFVESPIANPTAMAYRHVFELGYRDGPFPEDYDFWLRALAKGYRFAKLREPVLDWTDHPSRLTRSHPRYSPEAFDSCRREHLLSGPLKGVTVVDLWGAGQTGKPWLRWLQQESIAVRHLIEVSPAKIGQSIHGVPVIPPDRLPPFDGTPLIVAVGAEGARELILQHLRPLDHVPGKSTWFVA